MKFTMVGRKNWVVWIITCLVSSSESTHLALLPSAQKTKGALWSISLQKSCCKSPDRLRWQVLLVIRGSEVQLKVSKCSLLKNVTCQKILALSNRKLNDDKTSQDNTSYLNLTAANPENLKFDPHGIASFLRYYNQRFRVLPFSDFSPNSQLCSKLLL